MISLNRELFENFYDKEIIHLLTLSELCVKYFPKKYFTAEDVSEKAEEWYSLKIPVHKVENLLNYAESIKLIIGKFDSKKEEKSFSIEDYEN